MEGGAARQVLQVDDLIHLLRHNQPVQILESARANSEKL
jgi:hypothetical protein